MTDLYRIERLQTTAELDGLCEAWEQLMSEAVKPSVFATWEWANAWWAHARPDWTPYVLAAYAREGRLAGIAPWMLTLQKNGPLRLRRVTFFGSRFVTPVHTDVLARLDEKERVAGALLAHMRSQRDWDLLDLAGLSEASPLSALVAKSGGRYVEREPEPCPFIPLPRDWDVFFQKSVSANRRQQVRNRQRRLERDFPGEVVYRRIEHAADVPEAVRTLATLSQQRWRLQGLVSSLDDPSVVAFTVAWVTAALRRGWLRFYMLEVRGQPIAVELCYLYGKVFTNDQRGFDPAWERYSPGQLLYAHVIRQAIQEGAAEFDMLTGAHDYKLSWSDHLRYDRHAALSGSRRGDLELVGGRMFDEAQSLARKLLPAPARRRINRLITTLRPG